MAGFWFSRIHIIQSLPAGELRAGTVLRTAILIEHPDAAERVRLHDAADRHSLLAILTAIASELTTGGSIPFIHIEAHGSPDGLTLASGDLITWNEFRDLFTPVNTACGLNLFVSVSACHGDNLASAILVTAPAPVWGLIGPRTVEAAGTLADFFRVFLTRLLETNDLRIALDSAGGGLPPDGRPMVLWPADYFFRLAFVRYTQKYCAPPTIARRAKVLAARIQQQNRWPKDARRDLARRLRRDLRNLEPHFTKAIRTYLMLDQFPENESRFGLTWEELQKLWDQSKHGA